MADADQKGFALGISGSPRPGGTTDTLVKELLDNLGPVKTEFVSLADKQILPCTGCCGCVKSNICVIQDDFVPLREKILEADLLIIGAPNYFSMLNALTHCFLERFYQFRHRDAQLLNGKKGVAIGVGGGNPHVVIDNIFRFFKYNKVEPFGQAAVIGINSCYSCGFGSNCHAGAVVAKYGEGTPIIPDMIPSLDKQPAVFDQIIKIAAKYIKLT